MQVNNFNVRIEVRNGNVKKKLERFINMAGGFEILDFNNESKPDLMIFELGVDQEKEFQHIQSLIYSNSVGEIFLTSADHNSDILMQAIRLGAKEFITQPIKDDELQQALDRFKIRQVEACATEPEKIGKIISVIGTKGGVGTTTVAVNLATSLAASKAAPSVALVDMNMVFGEVPLFLDIKPKYHWGEIINNFSRLDSTYLRKTLYEHSSGVCVLPSPSYFKKNEIATSGLMEQIVRLLQRMFDFVVVDVGYSVGDISLSMLKVSDISFLIATISLPGLSNTNMMLKTFNSFRFLSPERFKVVINRYLKDSEISISNAEESINTKIFWSIPNDYSTAMSAINQGMPITEIAPNAPITNNLKKLAGIISKNENTPAQKQGAFSKQWNILKTKLAK